MLEHGFWNTEEGRLNYAMNVATIRSACHETVYQSIIHSLMNEAQAYTRAYNARYNSANFTIRAALEFEKWRFGIVNKTQHGLELLDSELCKYLGREGVKPDVWVFPPKMRAYASMVPPNALEFFRAGPQAVKNLAGQGDASAIFQNKEVFESREYAVDFSQSPIDQLSRERQTGDWFLTHVTKVGGDYTSSTLAYDQDCDDFVRVNGQALVDNCGFPIDLNDNVGGGGGGGVGGVGGITAGAARTLMGVVGGAISSIPTLSGAGAQMEVDTEDVAVDGDLPHLFNPVGGHIAADIGDTLRNPAGADVSQLIFPSLNTNSASDQHIVDAVNNVGTPSSAVRMCATSAAGLIAGVAHSVTKSRHSGIKSTSWYNNLWKAYKAKKGVITDSAPNVILRHAAANEVPLDFVNWVWTHVDSNKDSMGLATNAAGVEKMSRGVASHDTAPLSWSALTAIASNSGIEDLSPVGIAALRDKSESVGPMLMTGTATELATGITSVHAYWDAHLAQPYVESTDSMLGVRKEKALKMSFDHFCRTYVFSKDDVSALAVVDGAHRDTVPAAKLNYVSTEGAAVWKNLMMLAHTSSAWPDTASIAHTIVNWKTASADSSAVEALPIFTSADSSKLIEMSRAAGQQFFENTGVGTDGWTKRLLGMMMAAGFDRGFDLDSLAGKADGNGPAATDEVLDSIAGTRSGDVQERVMYYVFRYFFYTDKLASNGKLNLNGVARGKFMSSISQPCQTAVANLFEVCFPPRSDVRKFLEGHGVGSSNLLVGVGGFKLLFDKENGLTFKDDMDQQERLFMAAICAFLFGVFITFLCFTLGTRADTDQDPDEKDSCMQDIQRLFGMVSGSNWTEQSGVNFVHKWSYNDKHTGNPRWHLYPGNLEAILHKLLKPFKSVFEAVGGRATKAMTDDTRRAPRVLDKSKVMGVSGGSPSVDGAWFLCVRPFKTFIMGSGILARGGPELGVTFYGHTNFQWSNNTTTKVHEGHFTFYSRPVVRNVKHYAIAEDIFVMGYVRGEVGGKTKEEIIDLDELKMHPEIGDLHELYSGTKGSIIPYYMGPQFVRGDKKTLDELRAQIANPLSITGSWDCVTQAYSNYQHTPSVPATSVHIDHFPTARQYKQVLHEFYELLEREANRVELGSYNTAPGCYNTGTFQGFRVSCVLTP